MSDSNPAATYTVTPVTGPLNATIRPPGSKSITNRALICAALADGRCTLTGTLDSDDTQVMIAGLQSVGIGVEVSDNGQTLVVEGADGKIPAIEGEIFVGNSGTTVRFLTAALTLGHGAFHLDGVARMRERPIGDLVDALNQLGTMVRCDNDNNCPPLTIHANGLSGGEATISGTISSQYLSAVLMAAPCADSPVTIRVEGELVSKPYIEMTIAVMRAFGAEVERDAEMTAFHVAATGYRATDYAIEPDASAASYFWGAAAIAGGQVTVEGLSPQSLQGDVAFVDCLEKMGCRVDRGSDSITVHGAEKLTGITVDMNAISDTVQTLGAVALYADGATEITGVGHIRHKETDRIGDLATELRKLGATVEETESSLRIIPGNLSGASLATYDDHRMAMSFALVGLKQPGIVIENPGCTAKTYPQFFTDFESIYR